MKKKIKAAKRKPAKPTAAIVKDIFENEKVHVLEVTYKAGAESEGLALPLRVTRALKGGTLTRLYPDGKKEKVTFKTGEVKFGEPTQIHVIRNAGKKTIQLYSVFLK